MIDSLSERLYSAAVRPQTHKAQRAQSIAQLLGRLPTENHCTASLDHSIRPRQHVGRNGETDLLGGFEIDDQLELRRLFDRKVSGFCAFQNLVDIDRGASKEVSLVG